ncbi:MULTISPECIES: hypothetical protein [Rhizobium]|uniref:Uncharacterized protein n=1 Tax=Rhizobium phaseoli TaxID=396 RepID=A0A7T0H7S6_9HYPH|nr:MULTISPECIES: hypothetical protein [Rhizobium]MDE8762876.1 hypothetical protein [Rhizobium sp. CBK13]MDK4725074.1 hypothetical protein [Rhizobium phaseoli]QPK09898.1 hypothetical protein HER27_004845 [Rhizobium phaseoli]
MIAIDRPDERTIQPFPAYRANRGNENRARLKHRDIGIIAEMEKAHGNGSRRIGKMRIARSAVLVTLQP